jgi:hypothetical protein
MAQSGYTPILIYGSGTASNVPLAANMTTSAAGVELALNYADGKLYYKDGSGTIKVLAGTGGTGVVAGSNTQIQFNNSGVFGASSNLTWNGTTLAVTGSFTATNLSWNQTTLAITGNLTATTDSVFSSTGALSISKGTAAQRPGSASTSMIRYNTDSNEFEGYSGASPSWKSIGGSALSNDTTTATDLYPVFAGATSGTAQNLYTSNAKLLYKPSTGELQATAMVSTNGIMVNGTTVSSDYTIATGQNGFSIGPITVASGVSVTVSSGQRWVIQ